MVLEFGDRKAQYEEFTLLNGIHIYQDTQFNSDLIDIRILIPYGWLFPHTPQGILQFFPQLIGKRSPSWPEEQSFCTELSAYNGRLNIRLHYTALIIKAQLPNPDLAVTQTDKDILAYYQATLVEQVFNPVFKEDDLAQVKSRLRYKFNAVKPFYPGSDESSKILSGQWLNFGEYFEQQYGYSVEEAIDPITPETLEKCFNNIFRSDIKVVCGGGDCSTLFKHLEELKLHAPLTKRSRCSLHWQNPQFRYVPISDLHDVYRLTFGALLPNTSTPRHVIHSQLLAEMIGGEHQSLIHNRYREEQQKIYAGGSDCRWGDTGIAILVALLTNTKENVDYIVADLCSQIEKMISNAEYLTYIVERNRNQRGNKLDIQSAVLDELENDLIKFSRIVTEEEQYNQILEQAKDPEVMKALWNQMETGSICLYPAEFDQ